MNEAHKQRVEESGAATMRVELVGQTLVTIHAPCAIDPTEWTDYCRRVEHDNVAGILVFAPPGCPGPDADQRRQLVRAFKHGARQPSASIVTNSSVHRHLITAFNWLISGRVRGFAPSEIAAALAFAKVGAQDHDRTLATAKSAAQRMNVDGAFRESW